MHGRDESGQRDDGRCGDEQANDEQQASALQRPERALLLAARRLWEVLLGVLRPLGDSLVDPAGPAPNLFLVGGQIAAKAQQDGSTAAWIDAEHAFDPAYAAALGVALEKLLLARPDSAEQALGIARELALSGAVDLVVVDSAAALVPRVELETGLGDSGPGLQSRVLGSELRKLAAAVGKCSAAVLFLNQVRSRPDESDSTAGGPSLKLYAAIRIALEPAGGGQTAFRILKNKVAQPFSKGVLRRAAPHGFSKTP